MKIYFAGSIRGGRGDRDLYLSIIEELKKYGTVLTEHVGDSNLTSDGEKFDANYIYQRDVDWIKEADLVVAEVSTPSLGVGYELGLAESIGKKIICLYRDVPDKSLSAMVSGNSKLILFKYEKMDDLVNYFIKNLLS